MNKLKLGFFPLTNTIQLAQMKDLGDGTQMRIGNTPPRDVTDEAAQLVWQLVIAVGGTIQWQKENGEIMELSAKLIKP